MSKPDKALLKAVMRGWDARANSPSESIDNICEAVAAHIRRAQAKAWDEGMRSRVIGLGHEDNPYRGRAKR